MSYNPFGEGSSGILHKVGRLPRGIQFHNCSLRKSSQVDMLLVADMSLLSTVVVLDILDNDRAHKRHNGKLGILGKIPFLDTAGIACMQGNYMVFVLDTSHTLGRKSVYDLAPDIEGILGIVSARGRFDIYTLGIFAPDMEHKHIPLTPGKLGTLRYVY